MSTRSIFWLCMTGVAIFVLSCASGERTSELEQPAKWWEIQPRPAYASLEKVGTFQEWFEAYRLLEGTYAIYEPYQFEEAISYLVLGKERGVLVDAGTGIGDIKQVVAALTDLPVSVACTHEHYDHVGGAHGFEVAIYNHPAALERLRKGTDNASLQPYIAKDFLAKALPPGFDGKTWTIPPIEPTTLLEDGNVIDLGDRKLEVIYTPGHSPGSVCFLDRGQRLLLTGDHFYPGPLYAHTPDFNLDHYLASNERLSRLVAEYDHLLPGHNEPWVKSEVIPRVGQAFKTIFEGKGKFSEDSGLRRYYFDGFDILFRTEMLKQRS